MLIDRPPITEGWQLLLMLAVGIIVVATLHRIVRHRIARDARNQNRSTDD